jgi:hypothetical protein
MSIGLLIYRYYTVPRKEMSVGKMKNGQQMRHPGEGQGKSKSSQEDSSLLVHRDVGISL